MYRLPVAKRDMPKRFPGYSGPSQIDDSVVFTEPYEGTVQYLDLTANYYAGAAGTTVVFGATAPAGGMLWVAYAEAFHNDSANHPVWIAIEHRVATEVAVVGIGNVAAQIRAVIPRPLLVRGGFRLVARTDLMGAGKVVSLRMAYRVLEAGEGVPAGL